MTHSAATPLPSKVKKTQSRSERKMRSAKAAQRAEQADDVEQKQDTTPSNNAFADKKTSCGCY